MASSTSSSASKYPYPTNVNVGESVHVKLSPATYFMWSKFMLAFIEDQGLVGFINGAIPTPPEKITVTGDNGTNETIDNQDWYAWKKSDELLRRWIFATLNEDVLVHVHYLKTAKDVWTMLERAYSSQRPPDLVGRVSDMGEGTNISRYLPLHKAALTGDWESARTFIENDPDAVRAVVTGFNETALIVAVRSQQRNHFVKNLLDLMTTEDVSSIDSAGSTALHIAALVGNIEAAKLLVEKNGDLPNIKDTFNALLPIHRAALNGRKEMVNYLLTVTDDDKEPKPFEKESGGKLMQALIASGLYDIALFLLQRYPNLASEDPSPLDSIAIKPSAFRSGTRFNIWQLLLYSCVPMNLANFENKPRPGDVENQTLFSVGQKMHAIFWKVIEILVPQIKYIGKEKLKHNQALQLVKRLCDEIVKLDYSKASEILGSPLKNAICVGIREVVEEIIGSFPSVVYLQNEKKQSLLHVAIVNRREKVFNLIYQFECGEIFVSSMDVLMNNGLHLTGKLEPQQQLNLRASAAGAALQMQRELQWFKEVENFVHPRDKEQVNTEQKTPAMVFTETHKDLVKEGEQWMRDTANSCTIVAALIVTIVFAAAITVPGGNDGNTGLPIFYQKKAFAIFFISDALALFASTSSLLMFLSILTSRYGEEDFLYALPKRLIIGLVTLFLSILSMMIAFSATLNLVFGYKGRWILVAITALSGLPVTIFATLQFPLLLDLVKSTYKPGIFGKQSERILF